jgi:transposase-like protein
MPYMRCPRCGLSTFSVAGWSTVDRCERCEAELPRSTSYTQRRHDMSWLRDDRVRAARRSLVEGRR